eukprot:16542-Eustigmatos_ZCMA.PRE.1
MTALHVASKHGQTGVVYALLDAPGIKVNAGLTSGETALMEAADRGHTRIVDAFLGAPGISRQLQMQSTDG